MARIDSFLELVVAQKASDLHFHSGKVPTIRHRGTLLEMPFRSLSDTQTRRFLFEVLSDKQQAEFKQRGELDFIYEIEGAGRFRGNIFQQHDGVSAVLRVIPYQIPTLDQLDMPHTLKKLLRNANGLVLVTGPTGSGKTTTLAAMIKEINRTSERHVITVEDPIEFIHEGERSVITQRGVGRHVSSFADAVRSALREAPDVLVVGELRDAETIKLALTAAETGVLVIGTLHTSSAAKSINRVINALPAESREQMRGVLAMLLRGVVAQQLCRRRDGDGMVAVQEILLQSWAVASMIRDNKVHQIEGFLQSTNHATTGMYYLDNCVIDYVRDGLISLEEGLRVAHYPETVRHACADMAQD
jgi:twitching motility protein PilT